MSSGRINEPCGCGGGCDCGCCEGVEPVTPRAISNRPGLDALAYRIGTHSAFLETMQARLSSADFPALAGLTTRDPGDPSMALLDSWAVVADVLTFYQERIANEGYLRTATERRSVLELARLVGYAPRPGVAASVYLSYTLEEKPKPVLPAGSPVTPVSTSQDEPETVIPAGARAQSVPGPGEMQQPFETSDDLVARAAWNNLQVRLTRPQQPETFDGAETVPLYLQGIATNLKPNDPLLIQTGSDPLLYRVLEVKPDATLNRTQVGIAPWWAPPPPPVLKPLAAEMAAEASLSSAALQDAVDRASDLGTLGLSAGAAVKRVLADLEPLKAALAGGAGDSELRSAVEEALPKLREEQRGAESMGATRVSPWVAGLVAELEEVLGGADGGAQVSAALESSTETAKATTSLGKVLTSLGKPPTQPPAGSLRLERDAGALLAPGSDLSAKLLTLARPELKDVLYRAWANLPVVPPPTLKVCALRTRASVFGHNAPLELTRRRKDGVITGSHEWWTPAGSTDSAVNLAADSGKIPDGAEAEDVLFLDNSYPQVAPGSWIVLERPDSNLNGSPLLIATVSAVKDVSRAAYGLTGKSTRVDLGPKTTWLQLGPLNPDTFAVVRGTAVYAQCEELTLAEIPIAEPVCGGTLELAGIYDGLEPGRWLIVSGERTDIGDFDTKRNVKAPVPGVPAAEFVLLSAVSQSTALRDAKSGSTGTDQKQEAVPGERTHTTLTLATPLAYCYKRDTLTIYGNVAHATHGQTRSEVLGSGDGSKALQSFTLKQPPLTYISAPTPSGIASTLKVRVNDILWHEAESLGDLGPADRGYTLRTDDGGQTTVVFGNGQRGARLPTGSENVRATYRAGIGKPGNVKAGQISQLATRPLGVKDVINPLPATGGADRESRDQARVNTPLAVLALDRLISVQDYEDFTRTFAGVGKASAARLSNGRVQLVHVTLAGEDDIPIAPDSDLLKNLAKALRQFGDPRQPLQVRTRQRRFLVVAADVTLLAGYLWEAVEPKIRAALLDAFGFARRGLGQDALLSQVYATIQGVRGVDYVDVNLFAAKDPEDLSASLDKGTVPAGSSQPAPRLRASLAGVDGQGAIQPAQILYLTPEVADTLILKEHK